jgi:hypothetical protein
MPRRDVPSEVQVQIAPLLARLDELETQVATLRAVVVRLTQPKATTKPAATAKAKRKT